MPMRRGLVVLGATVAGVALLSVVGRLLGPAQEWRPEPYTAPALTDGAPEVVPGVAGPPAAEHDVVREDITVPVRGEELPATVFAPTGAGPHPAVAFVHGAGTGDRASFFSLAEQFAKAGIVTVAYDKRSDYSYFNNRDFDQLAEDALAVVGAMRARDDVDPERTGLWGLSEGGRVVPLAASRSADVRFVVTAGGAIRGPLRNTAWSVYEGLTAAGAPAGAARLAVRFLGGGYLFTLHLDPPSGVWAQVRQPALVIYGTEDYLVPPAESSRQIVDDLERGGNTSYAVRFFGGADHGLRQGGGYAPGYLRTMTDWIIGLPDTATGAESVAGTLPVQRYVSTPVPRTPWYGGTSGLVATLALTLAGAVVVPLAVRRRLPTGTGEWTAVRRGARWAVRAGVLAYGLMWAFVGLLIGLGYTRGGGQLLFQGGWAVVRAAGVLAVVAAVVAVAGYLTARRSGWTPSGSQRTLLVAYYGVAALLVLSVAYWGVFEPHW